MSQDKPDYYAILGVEKSATESDIKNAYRKLAKKFHPDVNPDDENAAKKFSEISEAYEVLSDRDKKRNYDNPSPFGGSVGFSAEDFMRHVHRQRARQHHRRKMPGHDINKRVRVTLEQLAKGAEVNLKIPSTEVDPNFSGSWKPCPHCGGQGVVYRQQVHGNAVVSTSRMCQHCNGSGQILESDDEDSTSDGLIRSEREFSFDIPDGIEDGMSAVFYGEGIHSHPQSEKGNLKLTFEIRPHDIFTNRNHVILLSYPITLRQAIEGDTIKIPTLYGMYDLKVDKGVESGHVYNIKDYGLKDRNGKKALMLVQVWYETPKNVTIDSGFTPETWESRENIPESHKVWDRIKEYEEKNYGNGKKS